MKHVLTLCLPDIAGTEFSQTNRTNLVDIFIFVPVL